LAIKLLLAAKPNEVNNNPNPKVKKHASSPSEHACTYPIHHPKNKRLKQLVPKNTRNH
jgi:hypothetical protein